MHRISIPKGARAVLLNLRYENHEAYVVGGCVRDSLLGKEPKDWDICTSATPDEVKELMHRRGIKTIDTGLQHGTVTVDMGTVGKYEVTTFRIDGNYTDGRHPDYVEFTESIYKDLSRRDFTINAMAYNSAGLIDPFHGRDDLQAGIIRCVGNPDERFEEDALRILRALRFAATYGFSIEEQTAAAIHKDAWMLKRIAAERINGELCKMLLGDGILNVLLNFSDVIATIIPEMEPCIGFEQNNKYHQYTVYEHIAHAVANYKGTDVSVKVALLLHDIGKPQCYTEDENGGHFHGHGVVCFLWYGAINKNHLEVNPVERYRATGSRWSSIAWNESLAVDLLKIYDLWNDTNCFSGIDPFFLKYTDCVNCFFAIVVKSLIAGQKFFFGRSENQSVVWCVLQMEVQ